MYRLLTVAPLAPAIWRRTRRLSADRPGGCRLSTVDSSLSTIDYRLSRLVALVADAQIQPGPGEMNLVIADLVAEQPSGRAVMLERNGQAPGEVAEPRDHDQRDVM